jgi:hypothetical protein
VKIYKTTIPFQREGKKEELRTEGAKPEGIETNHSILERDSEKGGMT